MNNYSRHEIEKFYTKFLKLKFDQNDVAHFYSISRDYLKGTIIGEVGDFLAHPNLKDSKTKGIVLGSIKNIMPKFEEILANQYKGIPTDNRPLFNGLGTDEDLINNLSEIFTLAGIDVFNFDKNSAPYREFVFCTIFLLGTFKILYGNRIFEFKVRYSHGVSLYLQCESENFKNNFALLTVLNLNNNWISAPLYFEEKLTNHIARRFEEGFLAAISYDNDKIHEKCSADIIKQGELWPCYHH